jgi:hypothetical protein
MKRGMGGTVRVVGEMIICGILNAKMLRGIDLRSSTLAKRRLN